MNSAPSGRFHRIFMALQVGPPLVLPAMALVLLAACGPASAVQAADTADAPPAVDAADTLDAPDAADASPEVLEPLGSCAEVFACMETACAEPTLPSPRPLPPPPLLPEKAGPACLSACAQRVQGPGRAAALSLAQCADLNCPSKLCSTTEKPASCFENCLLSQCGKVLEACPSGGPVKSCAAILRCGWLAPQQELHEWLACASTDAVASKALAVQTLACSLSKPADDSGCKALMEQCSCDNPPAEPGGGSCSLLLMRMTGGAPCTEAALLSAMSPASSDRAEELLECLAESCQDCGGGNCRGVCAASECAGELSGCLGERSGESPAGTKDCKWVTPCMDGCWAAKTSGCHAACAAQASPGAWQTWTALWSCELSNCDCRLGDLACLQGCRQGPCAAAAKGCLP